MTQPDPTPPGPNPSVATAEGRSGPVARDDLDVLADLVARHYHALKTSVRTIPPRTEQVTETALVDEPYTETVDVEGIVGNLGSLWRRVMGAIVLGARFIYGIPAAFVAFLVGLVAGLIRKRAKGGSPALGERLRTVSRRNLDAFRQSIRKKRHEVQRMRQVERTITREVEIEPERTVEETVASKTRILAAGRGSIAFNATPTPKGVIATGPDLMMQAHELSFPSVRYVDRIFEADEGAKVALQRIPWVLDGEASTYSIAQETDYGDNMPLRGLEREMRDHCTMMAEAFADRDETRLTLEAVVDPQVLSALEPTSGRPAASSASIGELVELIDSKGGSELEDLAGDWVSSWAQVNATLFQTRKFSLCDQVAPECFDLGTLLNYSAFNFYCPECNSRQQRELLTRDYSVHNEQSTEPMYFSRNSRCVYHPDTEVWRCLTCESETKNPIPLHKMFDEVLMPAYERLMDEHKVERLNAHRDVSTREIENRNAMESDLERTQFDYLAQIDSLTEEMERLKSDISGERMAIGSMEDILTTYNVEQTRVMENIRAFSGRIEEEVQERTSQVLKRVDEIKEREMEALHQELQGLSRAKRLDDERRDAVQSAILKANVEQVEATYAVREAVQENTAVAAAGFQSVTTAVEQNTAVTSEGFHSVTAAVDRGTAVQVEGFERMERRQLQGNAIQAAVAKVQGIEVTAPSWSQPFRKLGDIGSRIAGALTGRTEMEREAGRLE